MGDDDDNIYINEVIARQMAEDLIEQKEDARRKIRASWLGKGWKCKCGSERFNVEENTVTCLHCGHVYNLEDGKLI